MNSIQHTKIKLNRKSLKKIFKSKIQKLRKIKKRKKLKKWLLNKKDKNNWKEIKVKILKEI